MTITLDIETSELNPLKAIVHLICYRIVGTTNIVKIIRPEKGVVNETLYDLLSSPTNTLRGHNIKFDALCLSNWGYDIRCKFDDTRILAYLAWPDKDSDLKSLTRNVLRREVRELDDLGGIKLTKKKHKKNRGFYERSRRFVNIGDKFFYLPTLISYCESDVVNCDALHAITPTNDWYNSVEQPLLKLLFEAEKRGAQLDTEYLKQLDIEFAHIIAPLYEKLCKIVENPGSPQQVAAALSKMGFDLSKLAEKTKTGRPKIDKMFLKRQSWKGHPFCQTLLEFRKYDKLRNTYTTALLEGMDSTGRIHGSFNQAGSEKEDGESSQGTRTGRLTSSDPNLQNIPARTLAGKAIRKAFVGTKGWYLFDKDLSQIEPRCVGHFSQSSKLVNAYKNGVDTHGMFGSDIFGKPIEALTKMERFIGKTSWLATTYGCWYKKLLLICEINSEEPLTLDTNRFIGGFDSLNPQYRAKLISQSPSEEEARQLYGKWMFFNEVQENFWKTNPEIKNWRQAHIERTRRLGYITTIGGRVIKINDLDSKNEWDVKAAEREAVNYLIQGSAADIMKLILRRYQTEIVDTRKGHLIAVVHDEILGELKNPEDIILVDDIMCNTVKLLNIDIKCDGGIINNWGEKK